MKTRAKSRLILYFAENVSRILSLVLESLFQSLPKSLFTYCENFIGFQILWI